MCSVVGALGMVGSGLSALGSYAADSAAAEAQYNAQVDQNNIAIMQAKYERDQKANNAIFNYEQLNNKEIEVNEQAANEKGVIAKEADKRRAEQRVASSYNGTASATIDRLLGDIYGDESDDLATVDANRDSQLRSVMADRKATQMRAEPTPLWIQQPAEPSVNGLALLTGAVGGGIGALGSYIRNKPVATG